MAPHVYACLVVLLVFLLLSQPPAPDAGNTQQATLTRTPSLRSTRSRAGFLSNTLRRNHLLLLYAFAGFLLLRMWFFAFSRHDSKLISFCAFIMLLAAYIWWSRRGRLARQSRQAALVEQMVAEGRLPMVLTQRRLHEEIGISAEGKEALKYFEYSTAKHDEARRDESVSGSKGEGRDEEEGTGAATTTTVTTGTTTDDDSTSTLPSAPPLPSKEEEAEDMKKEREESRVTMMEEGAEGEGVTKSEGLECATAAGLDPHVHIDQHCAVCLTDYEDGDRLCILPCLHCYHATCIEVWLGHSARCPLCNYDCNSVGGGETHGADSPLGALAAEHHQRYDLFDRSQ